MVGYCDLRKTISLLKSLIKAWDLFQNFDRFGINLELDKSLRLYWILLEIIEQSLNLKKKMIIAMFFFIRIFWLLLSCPVIWKHRKGEVKIQVPINQFKKRRK